MKPIWIIIFLGAVVALAFIPFFSGRILFEDDVTYYYLPSFKFYSDVLKSGESFYINPYVFSGFPQYLSQVGGFYEPINYIIFKFLPFPFSYHFRIFLNYWLAAIFMFLFGRTLGLGKDPNDFSRVLFIECTDCLAENRKIQSPPAIVLKEIKK